MVYLFHVDLYKHKTIEKEGITMKYSKPVVLNSASVNSAVCGGGTPCGRPCDKKA